MAHHSLGCVSSRIAHVLITVIIAVLCQPVLLVAQDGLEASEQYLPDPSTPYPAIATGATVIVDQGVLQQAMLRLETAEAEIRWLRQRYETADTTAVSLTNDAENHAEFYDEYAPEAITADTAKLLKVHSMGECGDITFKPGLRLHPRYTYDNLTDNNDFFFRRVKFKTSGNAYDVATYYTELKIDNVNKRGIVRGGKLELEAAFLDFKLIPDMNLRLGMYDAPFSRNVLTSDSKLLFMDRSRITDRLNDLGLADNTIGLLFHGRPMGGRFTYAVGIFDNVDFELPPPELTDSRELMPSGRIAFDLLDPAKPEGYADYYASYIGQGERLTVGGHAAHLGNATDSINRFDLQGFGADVFYNSGPFVFEAEYNWYQEDMLAAIPNLEGEGYYVQAGYLLNYWQVMNCTCPNGYEIAGRYQTLDINKDDIDEERWTSIGLNIYIREHNIKIQTEFTLKREGGVEIDNDIFQTQMQFDY